MKEKNIRRNRKTVYFNDPEMRVINAFCDKYHITNKSALFRRILLAEISSRLEESSKLF